MKELIENNIKNSILLKSELLDDTFINQINKFSQILIDCYTGGNKVYFCGNGGSYSDAQHLSAELSGRFYYDRDPLEVVLLSSNISYMTAVANDYDYDQIFLREFKSSYRLGDVVICFTTSGNSKNILNLLEYCKPEMAITIGLLGNDGGEVKDHCELPIIVPSKDTARIQECHMLIGHTVLEIVEKTLFPK